MIIYTSKRDATMRIKRNNDEKIFEYIKNKKGKILAPPRQGNIKNLKSIVDLSGFPLNTLSHFDLNEYFVARPEMTKMIIYRSRCNPDNISELKRLLSLPTYDPTNGIMSDKINYIKISIDNNESKSVN